MFMPYFYDLGLSTKIISVLDKLGFECPTSVQKNTITYVSVKFRML